MGGREEDGREKGGWERERDEEKEREGGTKKGENRGRETDEERKVCGGEGRAERMGAGMVVATTVRTDTLLSLL